MQLAERAGIEFDPLVLDCFDALDREAPADYRELAALLAVDWKRETPRRVGLSGGQGAGKTTLGGLIEAACTHVGLRACVLSLDDFYLTKAERWTLASRVHPLFGMRGPPGTHDMDLCTRALEGLLVEEFLEIPVFDKGLDDRSGVRRQTGPFDLVLLEGWCIAARAVAVEELDPPCNRLESERDAAGVWRRAVNAALSERYEPVWKTLETLVYLRVPNVAAIRRWRLAQEEERHPERRMTAEQVDRFVQYFERITNRMQTDLPAAADWVVNLDDSHRIDGLTLRDHSGANRAEPSRK